jgi:hypothetical protein
MASSAPSSLPRALLSHAQTALTTFSILPLTLLNLLYVRLSGLAFSHLAPPIPK